MLKSLLQLLLNTRTTKAEAAHFAQPAWGASPIVMTGTDVNELQSYILSITEAHTIAGIHTKRASKHPCM